MASVRALLTCIGVEESNVSILGHFFGFRRRRVPPDPVEVASVSLLQQVRGVQGQHIHLNVIRVGFDLIPVIDLDTAIEMVDYAIYRTRNIFRPINLGVGRVEYYSINSADADGNDDLGGKGEATALRKAWSVPNNGLDVFVVRNIADNFLGLSPRPGRCVKDRKNDGLLGGAIFLDTPSDPNDSAARSFDGFSRTFAHEIGHFMGERHNHDDRPDCPNTAAGRNNLMAQTRCVNSVRDAVLLTTAQENGMRGHCSVQNGCPI
jgi:hypothetical protein